MKSVGNRLNNFGTKIANIGAGFTGLGGAISAPLLFASKTFADFDDQTRKLAAVLGTSVDEIGALTDQAKALGASTAFTAGNVAQLQTELAKLGFDESSIVKMTDSLLSLGSVTQAELGTVAAVAGSTLRAFGLEADQTNRVVDVMAKSFSSSSLDLEKFQVSMAKVGPIAKNLGFDLEGTTALLGALVDKGIDSSTAGTSLRSLFLKLADPASGLTKALGGPVQSIDELGPALQRLADSGIDVAAALELTDKRSVTAFLSILNGSDAVQQLNGKLKDSTGFAKAAAIEMEAGLGGAARKLISVFEGVQIALGNALERTLLVLAERLQDVGARVNEFVTNNEELFDIILKIGIGLVAFGGIMTGIGLAIKFAGIAIALIGGAISALLSPVVLIGAGIVAATIAFLRFTEIGRGVAASLKEVITSGGGIRKLFDDIKEAFQLDGISGVFEVITDRIFSTENAIGRFLEANREVIKLFLQVGASIAAAVGVSAVFSTIMATIGTIGTAISAIVATIATPVGFLALAILAFIRFTETGQKAAVAFVEGLQNVGARLFQVFKSIFAGFQTDGITGAFKNLRLGVNRELIALQTTAKLIWETLIEQTAITLATGFRTIQNLWTEFYAGLRIGLSALVSDLASSWDELGARLAITARDIAETFGVVARAQAIILRATGGVAGGLAATAIEKGLEALEEVGDDAVEKAEERSKRRQEESDKAITNIEKERRATIAKRDEQLKGEISAIEDTFALRRQKIDEADDAAIAAIDKELKASIDAANQKAAAEKAIREQEAADKKAQAEEDAKRNEALAANPRLRAQERLDQAIAERDRLREEGAGENELRRANRDVSEARNDVDFFDPEKFKLKEQFEAALKNREKAVESGDRDQISAANKVLQSARNALDFSGVRDPREQPAGTARERAIAANINRVQRNIARLREAGRTRQADGLQGRLDRFAGSILEKQKKDADAKAAKEQAEDKTAEENTAKNTKAIADFLAKITKA